MGNHNKARTLSGGRKKNKHQNPGVVDGIETIKAPYSQDNVKLFGLIAGSQYVAMSQIYCFRLPTDIMNIGNELYYSLPTLSGELIFC